MKLYHIDSGKKSKPLEKIKKILRKTPFKEDKAMNQDRLAEDSDCFRFEMGADIMADVELKGKTLMMDVVPYENIDETQIRNQIVKAIPYRPLKILFSSKEL